ncbi:MAG: hypothetical protein RR977_00270 [Oscillospiraceae bacterium]
MRIVKMCPQCGSVIGREDDGCKHDSDTCQYCNINRIIVDFDAEILHNTPTTEFHAVEQKINRKFLYQLPTFDEEAYESRIKSEEKAHENLEKMFKELDNLPRCPYCKSVNLSKITAGGRLLSVGFLGFASGKMGKQWHCKECGSDF